MTYSRPIQQPPHVLQPRRINSRPAATAGIAGPGGSAFSRATTRFRQARTSCSTVRTPASLNASVNCLATATPPQASAIPAPVVCRRQAFICLAADNWLRIRRTASVTTSRRASSRSGSCASQASTSASSILMNRRRFQGGMNRSAAARQIAAWTSASVTESARNSTAQLVGQHLNKSLNVQFRSAVAAPRARSEGEGAVSSFPRNSRCAA